MTRGVEHGIEGILCLGLATRGIIRSRRGFRLARPAGRISILEQITLEDILQATS